MMGRRLAGFMAAGAVVLGGCHNPLDSDDDRDPCEFLSEYALEQTFNGRLGTGDCVTEDGAFVDFYRFILPATTDVTITQRSEALDSKLLLYRGDGTLVTSDDDSDPETTAGARITATLPAGTYLIGASSFDDGESGDYQISSTRE